MSRFCAEYMTTGSSGGRRGNNWPAARLKGSSKRSTKSTWWSTAKPRHRTDVGVGVPVHVAGGPHVDLDDRELLSRQNAFATGFGPDAGDHADDVDSGREKRPVPGPVHWVTPGMEDAQHAHAALRRTSQ